MATPSQQNSSKKFSENLRLRASRLNIQASEIAERLKVEPSAVSNWMNGANPPKLKNLRALADVLRCNAEWLTGEVDQLRETAIPYNSNRSSDSELEIWRNRAIEAEKQLHTLRTGIRSLLEITSPMPAPNLTTHPKTKSPEDKFLDAVEAEADRRLASENPLAREEHQQQPSSYVHPKK